MAEQLARKNIKFRTPNSKEWQEIETDSEEQQNKTACDQNKKDLAL